jgi:HlyD family secretion protein
MKMKPILRLIAICLIIAALGGGLYHYWNRRDQVDDRLKLYGNVEIRQIQLAFHATGRIRLLTVNEGDRVERGQLVAEIDPARYEAAVAQARAHVTMNRKTLDRLLAGSRPEEIAASRAKVEAAEATLWDAEHTNRRMQALLSRDSVSKQQADDAETAFKSARANRDAAREEMILAMKGPREEDIAAARAQLKAQEAALTLAERELTDTKLYAPAAAVVRNRILEPGDMASIEAPVYTLALTDPVWIRAYVSEPDLGKISPGMQAEVSTDSFPGKIYRGQIGYISPTAEFTPKEIQTTELREKLVYQVRIYISNPENQLRLGMPATVSISLRRPYASQADKTVPEK